MILILGSKNFIQSIRVYDAIQELGHEAFFLDCDGENDLEVEVSQCNFKVCVENRDLLDAELVWNAAKFPYKKFGDNQIWADEYIAGTMRRVSIENILELFPEKVINPLETRRLSSSKILQLRLAIDVGFDIPRSLLTASIERIKSWRGQNDRLIVKCLGESEVPVIDNGVMQHIISTCRLDLSLLADSSVREPFPIFVQDEIQKKYEHRAVLANGRIFNFRIDPHQHNLMEVDYRHGGYMVNYQPSSLPDEVETLILRYAARARLFTACFDLIESNSGNFIFLEVNPEGVWGLHDEIVGGKISSWVAHSLVSSLKSDVAAH